MEIKPLHIKTKKCKKYKNLKFFLLGNFYIATGLLNFNNINWEYIFIEKWNLKLGLYWGIANLGLGLRINDSLLIRIIGLNILGYIPLLYVGFDFFKKDENEGENYSTIYDDSLNKGLIKKKYKEDSNKNFPNKNYFESLHTANRTKKPTNYILMLLPLFSLFNFMSIEIKIAEYWRFNINFTQTIFILLKELEIL